jgi:reactive chlorine resistance protein C
MVSYLRLPLEWIANYDKVGMQLMRVAIAIVFLWIGALKFVPYEADSITPFVANSPFMSFFYEHPDEYRAHLTHEGELKPAERAWQTENNTYEFSKKLGSVEITHRQIAGEEDGDVERDRVAGALRRGVLAGAS